MERNQSDGDDEALYQELGKIGRQRHPLDPAGLTKRRLLLKCDAVTRRAGAGASHVNLAYHASLALAASVTGLTDSVERRIGSAVFGLDEFDGQSVEDRKAVLDSKYGISRDVYAARRPEVVRKVIFALTSPQINDASQDHDRIYPRRRGAPAGFHDPHVSALSALHTNASYMYHAGAASLFIAKVLRTSGTLRSLDPQHAPAEAMFDAIALLCYSRYEPIDLTNTALPSGPRGLNSLEELSFLLKTLRDYSPFTASHFVTLSRHAEGLAVSTGRARDVRQLYLDVWLPWYVAELQLQRTELSAFEVVVAKCGMLAYISSGMILASESRDYIGRSSAFWEWGVRLTEQYFGVGQDADVSNSWALRNSVMDFTSDVVSVLVFSDIVWYDSEMKQVTKKRE